MAMTLGHLETWMHAARVLRVRRSTSRHWRSIQEACGRGYRAKAEELIRDLLGPVYLRSGEQAWSPMVAGLVKRELLKDVLSAFARSKTLTKLAQDWQDVLKRASEDGDR
ncbi:hypothetical protein B0H14DRAFT_3172368 [Mycena olivaceomarginata]|nr:hypothetical protein B0H14DRAFT_3172368 [Mycena olivaceomarginata]